MAIQLEFINIIAPLDKIEQLIGRSAAESRKIIMLGCMDDHLYREGCMNEIDLRNVLAEWKNMGFELLETRDEGKFWKDVCVAYSGHGPSYPCPWLEYDQERNIIWMKGKDAGRVVLPGSL